MDREATRVKAKGWLGFAAVFCGAFAYQLNGLVDTGKIAGSTWLLIVLAAMNALALVGGFGVAYTDKTLANHTNAAAGVLGAVTAVRGVIDDVAEAVN